MKLAESLPRPDLPGCPEPRIASDLGVSAFAPAPAGAAIPGAVGSGRSARSGYRHLALPGLIVAAMLAVLACSEGGRGGSEESLSIAIHGEPSTLDPHLQAEFAARSVLANIYDSLVDFDRDMTLIPALAVSWYSPSDELWRFRLREGVRFHDGRPLEVADVVASLERARLHPRSLQQGAMVGVISVEAAGPRTVEVTTAGADPLLLTRLAYVRIAPRDAPETITEPVGTGPFRFVGRLGESIELALVEGNWRAVTSPRRAAYHFVSDPDERFAGLVAGRYDLVTSLGARALQDIENHPELRAEHRPSFEVTYLQMDPTHPPYDDWRVRRAIHLAIDRTDLARGLYGEHAVPLARMVTREVFGFDPRAEIPKRDLAEARRLLEEAGHGAGLTLTLELREGIDVEPLRRQLEQVGIRLEVDSRPWADMYARLVARKPKLYLGTWNSPSGDGGEVLDRKLHSHVVGGLYGDANFTRHVNPELDRAIEAIRGLLDPDERLMALQGALATASADWVYLPLYSPHELYGLRADLDWAPRQDGGVLAFGDAS